MYDTSMNQQQFKVQEQIRTHFSNNPFLVMHPKNLVSAKIYMFHVNSWYLCITYNNGFYKLTSYK